MQRYSHPDVFLCPSYNLPGVADPKMNLCGALDDLFNPHVFAAATASRPESPRALSELLSSASSSVRTVPPHSRAAAN